MNDPLERLSDAGAGAPAPDLDAIRARARRIRSRRYAALGSSTALVAAVLVVAVVSVGQPGLLQTDSALSPAPAQERQSEAEARLDSMGDPAEPDIASASEADELSGGQGAPAEAQARPPGAPPDDAQPGDGLQVTIEVAPQTVTPQGSATFTLVVCNPHEQAVELRFRDAQRYDFEVRRAGSPVWTWSSDRMFTQAVGSETWAPSECRRFQEDWDGTDDAGSRQAPGSYEAVGILMSTDPIAADPGRVCVTRCD